MFKVGDIIDVEYLSKGNNPIHDDRLEVGRIYQIEICGDRYFYIDGIITYLGTIKGNCHPWYVRYLKDRDEWVINSYTNTFGNTKKYTIEECF